MAESVLSQLVHKSREVETAYGIFKEDYKNSIEENPITNIISGESIQTKPENIHIDDKCLFVDDMFDKKCEYCTKKLYAYQRKSIFKLRELELSGKIGNDIITNACVLSLPIGAGKSLCYECLSMFYREVPKHPIILSTDMRSIPHHDVMQFKYYPYFCEKPAYVKDEVNAVQVLENYKQRPITLVLTHDHLIEQMRYYFETDFDKRILRTINIQFCRNASECDLNFKGPSIIVVPASAENVKVLSEASYQMPFMRIIADDMTDFPLEKMRQILASFTIFVSGSGFQRKPEEIPISYYSLKEVPYQRMSVVGDPKETYEGVMRNNIMMVKLLGTNNPFSQYAFVTEMDKLSDGMFRARPQDCYPIIAKEPYLTHYITLAFMIKNIDVMKVAINRIEQDLECKLIPESKVSYYKEWKTAINTPNNPLYNFVYNIPQNNSVANKIGTIVTESCLCCGADIKDNNGYGVLSTCCGAFYCSKCLKSMVTHKMEFPDGNIYTDTENYYCCSCREKNCKFMLNSTKIRDRNIYAFSLVDDFFKEGEDGTLKDHYKVDYYFYMFLHGLTPMYFEGKPLRITKNDNLGEIDFMGPPPQIEKVFPTDHLAIRSLYSINKALGQQGICPRRGTSVLFFTAPEYMHARVMYAKNNIIKVNDEKTMVQYGKKKIQPIENLDFVFRDSVASLIGLHSNILAIIVWNKRNVVGEEEIQMLGRIYRLNGFNNPLYFYIENSIIELS